MGDLQGSYATAAIAQPNSLLPTPPCSPDRTLRPSHPIDSTLHLLESLIAFYHQERMWVYRTRASLELVLEAAPSGGSDTYTSAAESDLTTEEDGSTIATPALGGIKAELTPPSGARDTLWMRRKKSFKLKLQGISTRGKPRHTTSGHEVPLTPGVQILELFENMMQARMESCERVTKLVKDANTLKD
jgi:hypothetical protein